MINYISHLRLRNIKTFVDTEFDLAPLTLLTGQNGLGKSTLIQALLLLRQSFLPNGNNRPLEKLLLNPPNAYIGIGRAKDLYAVQATDETTQYLSIDLETIKTDEYNQEEIGDEVQFTFEYRPTLDSLNRIVIIDDIGSPIATDDFQGTPEEKLFQISALFQNTNRFQYIGADRILPTENFSFSQDAVNKKDLGIRGQFTIGYIAMRTGESIGINALKHENAPTDELLHNLDAWLQDISPNIHIMARVVQNNAILRFTFDTEQGSSDEFTPVNVGFGLTNVLPVLTAILIAQPNDLIIIENPEAHLHPAAQSLIGKLCAIAAQNGVQCILETHSDHVLNGVRVAAKQNNIEPENIAVYFFERVEGYLITDPIRVWIDGDGRMDKRPTNFFDEANRQLTELIKP